MVSPLAPVFMDILGFTDFSETGVYAEKQDMEGMRKASHIYLDYAIPSIIKVEDI